MGVRRLVTRYLDRIDAGWRLGERLRYLSGEDVVVLALPRGGVPVAAGVAHALHAPLDVIIVRKLGVPHQPEFAMGALGEGGVRIINDEVVAMAGVTPQELAAIEERERAELERRGHRFQRPAAGADRRPHGGGGRRRHRDRLDGQGRVPGRPGARCRPDHPGRPGRALRCDREPAPGRRRGHLPHRATVADGHRGVVRGLLADLRSGGHQHPGRRGRGARSGRPA